jgi:tryptophan synthase beta chain
MSYQVNEKGYYGEFGGAFIPEMLYPNVKHLEQNYLKIIESESFQTEFVSLLKHYVGRPSPLYYSKRLSDKYGIRLYLKREDLNHTGSHKINNTIGQILMAKHLGKKRIIAETGAGQHGVATATVCAREGLECIVFMGATDVARQMPNVEKMQMLGATVVPVQSGNKTLKDATNEAIRDWINHPDETHYIIGSVVGPHPYPDMVARFQSIISAEIKQQLLEQTGSPLPDSVIACVGGGSNAAGAFYHFLNEPNVKLIAVEADGKGLETGETAATMAAGRPGIIHGSLTLLMQTDDGQIVEPYSISAGLDYPGIGPLHSHLFKSQRALFIRATDDEALAAAFELTRMEGIIPALESAHALAALSKLSFKKDETVVINISGRGDKDMEAYRNHMKNIKNKEQENTQTKLSLNNEDVYTKGYTFPTDGTLVDFRKVTGLYIP